MKKSIFILSLIIVFLFSVYWINDFFQEFTLKETLNEFVIKTLDSNSVKENSLISYFIDEEAYTKAVINRSIYITNYTCKDSDLSQVYNSFEIKMDKKMIAIEVLCGTTTKSSIIEIIKDKGKYKIESIK